jgi:regulator of sirC expression with transglutaminase-like and TPR domain
MKTAVANSANSVLSENQRVALINLLADDDAEVYATVRQKILSLGPSACDWLQPFTLSNDPVVRRRTKEIILWLGRRDSDQRFLTYCQHSCEDLDLEEATGLLAQTQYPEINLEGYTALYDSWSGELKTRINFTWESEKILGTINHFLFVELRFSGNEHYAYSPDSSYLNRVVDTRSGNPVSLCALYLFLTRRLCLPVAGIGMPGHFICRFQSSTKELYLDAFRGGRFLSKADCVKYLTQSHHGLQSGFLSPVSTRRILSRMCGHLHQTYAHLELPEEALRIQRYLAALSK